MQVSHEKSPVKDFRPFTISITFESQEEAELMKNMLRFNMTIPRDVMCIEGEQAEKFTFIMLHIREEIEAAEKE